MLSDIHGNFEALTAVLDHLAVERIDRYVCLGDLVGYGADPEACLSRLQGCQAVSVAGNHDWACVGKLDVQWFNELARQAVLWTRERLGFTDLEYLRRLPLVATEGPLTLVHGTLSHPDRFEYLADLAQAVDTVRAGRTAYCLAGHTHVPFVFEYDLNRQRMTRMLNAPQELAAVHLAAEDAPVRYVINPGSVGQPRDGDPRASAAILDTEARTLSVRRLAYDVETAQRKILDAGLPDFLAARLALGR
ncbi:MAG: metallophosphoesterase family protein [Candidatus Omnitrophica bacterium]|nr:metallophosphoesterase family protein [Candidatus Omnitrophota bacterium]